MNILKKLKNLKTYYKYREVSAFIDRAFYYSQYPDVEAQKVDPLTHYILNGWKEGRDPSPWFSTSQYLKLYPDVEAAGVNPLLHYVRHGRNEMRVLPSVKSAMSANPLRFVPRGGVDHRNEILRYIFFSRSDDYSNFDNNEKTAGARQIVSSIRDSGVEGAILPLDNSALELHMATIYDHFDADFYVTNNEDVRVNGIDPLKHYCMFGWRELRDPRPDFNVWWYWQNYLDPTIEAIDPLLHFVLVGEAEGFETRCPGPIALTSPGISLQNDRPTRRICLFAAYDAHGLVDEYVIDYLTELSQFADIYYLADCDMQPGELEKLNGIVMQAWSQRHGEYDFGSYSRLARELVGWKRIAEFDELIFANDSCYLVNELEPIFVKMDAKVTDWWGLQATKGLHSTRRADRKRFPVAIPIELVKNDYLADFERDYTYNFHLGSYFTAYRKNIINDPDFQYYINNIAFQESKLNIVKKYEIGLTRFLIQKGYNFETFVEILYPLHPVYSDRIFDLIRDGFPLLKRYLFSDNHYYVSGLADWKERLAEVSPDANITAIESNIYRVCDSGKLYRNFRVRADDNMNPIYPPLLSNKEMAELDAVTPKYDNWWIFPACAYDKTFASNERAVFEAVRYDPNIKKIILTRGKHVDIDGENVEIYPLNSQEGQNAILKAKVIFIKHTPTSNAVYPISPKLHYFVNLWHGIPLKRIGYASLDTADKREILGREHRKFVSTISSSKVDTMAMAAGFYPLSYNDIWMTGLPRNDFIVREFAKLPDDLQREEEKICERIGVRKLILFCPTFRNGENGVGFEFSEGQINQLNAWLEEHGAVLGIREHMADRHKVYSSQLKGPNVIDVSSAIFPNIEVLYRVSSCLVTDYSSCFIDYILTGNQVISFAYDFDDYQSKERGTFYDLDFAFPGDICQTFEEVIDALDKAEANGFRNSDPSFSWKKRLFFEFDDDQSSARVVRRVKGLLGWGD